MRLKNALKVSACLLGVLILCALWGTQAQAATRPLRPGLPALYQAGKTIAVNSRVYLTGQMLQPLFQDNLNQAFPQMVGSALNDMVKQLPKQDQGWALQMANALLQPSASMLSVKTEKNGLLATLKVSLYPGDPKAITSSILVGFKVINASTIQITALPSPEGGASLVSGPLATFKLPIGSLTAINTTPQCGQSDLSVSLKFPVQLSQSATTPATAATPTPVGNSASLHLASSSRNWPLDSKQPAAHPTTSYIELPASSLAQLGSSFGTIQVSKSLTARNIRLSVQSSNLIVTSDIYWYGLKVGTAVSTMLPGAAHGNLVVHVLKTSLHIGFLSFPLNSYNQQIENTFNTNLNGALAGTFYVNQAKIGFDPQLSCASSTSLVLGGELLVN